MPTCRVVRRLLSDAADHQLPWWASAMVRLHLALCAPCRSVDASLRRTLEALAALGGPGPEPGSGPAAPGRETDPAGS